MQRQLYIEKWLYYHHELSWNSRLSHAHDFHRFCCIWVNTASTFVVPQCETKNPVHSDRVQPQGVSLVEFHQTKKIKKQSTTQISGSDVLQK